MADINTVEGCRELAKEILGDDRFCIACRDMRNRARFSAEARAALAEPDAGGDAS